MHRVSNTWRTAHLKLGPMWTRRYQSTPSRSSRCQRSGAVLRSALDERITPALSQRVELNLGTAAKLDPVTHLAGT
jgi:hypothetical protein